MDDNSEPINPFAQPGRPTGFGQAALYVFGGYTAALPAVLILNQFTEKPVSIWLWYALAAGSLVSGWLASLVLRRLPAERDRRTG